MLVVGQKVLVKPTEGNYSISSETGLELPEGFDLSGDYSEGVVVLAGTRSMCHATDRVVYLKANAVMNGDTVFVNDKDIVLYERF